MVDANIAYIKTEPITPLAGCVYVDSPNYRCTIELVDGSIIMRCGATEQHALANAVACYRTWGHAKPDLQRLVESDFATGATQAVDRTE